MSQATDIKQQMEQQAGIGDATPQAPKAQSLYLRRFRLKEPYKLRQKPLKPKMFKRLKQRLLYK